MAQSSYTFGNNLPKEYANLAGRTLENIGGGQFELPQYMQNLLADSQPVAAGATASNSPGAVAPAAAAQRYAQLSWKGAPGREMLPQLRSRQDSWQVPIEQLNDFMQSGMGQNYRVTGSFNEGDLSIPKATVGKYTDPLTGEIGHQLLTQLEGGGYSPVTGGYLPAGIEGWDISKLSSPVATEEVKTEAITPVSTVPQPTNPYVLSETPEAFRYAKGGLVEVGEQLRDKGRMGDTILAHINPDEARMLKMMGGSGTINPETGLPEYFSIGKVFKKLLGAAAPLVGNAIAPGIGGILGGALGGAVSGGGIEGALTGGLGAGLGNWLGGSSALGGLNIGGLFGGSGQVSGGSGSDTLRGDVGSDDLTNKVSTATLGDKIGAALKDPLVLGGLGIAALSGLGNDTEKKNRKLLQAQREERRQKEEQESQEFRDMIAAQTARTVNVPPPDYYTYGTRPEFNYFGNNTGGVKMAAKGGYIEGAGGGQDDAIPARLSNNEYVIPADVVSHLGDGAPRVGAKKLDELIGNVRKHKAVKGHPPKTKPMKAYMGGLAHGRA